MVTRSCKNSGLFLCIILKVYKRVQLFYLIFLLTSKLIMLSPAAQALSLFQSILLFLG